MIHKGTHARGQVPPMRQSFFVVSKRVFLSQVFPRGRPAHLHLAQRGLLGGLLRGAALREAGDARLSAVGGAFEAK